jgi:hypothetical protein
MQPPFPEASACRLEEEPMKMSSQAAMTLALLLVAAPLLGAGAPANEAGRGPVGFPGHHKIDPIGSFSMKIYDGQGSFGFVEGDPGLDDVVNVWSDGQFMVRFAEGNAHYRVCPAGRGVNCGSGLPGAPTFLKGSGTLTARGWLVSNRKNWCSFTAQGHAIVEDENGQLYDMRFLMVRSRSRFGDGCPWVHQNITVTPMP